MSISNDYANIFTPGAPVQDRSFLMGREQELFDISHSLKSPGLHPVIIGFRGVGKTSLVQHALASVADECAICRYGCYPKSTFEDFSQATLRQLNNQYEVTEIISQFEKGIEGGGGFLGVGVKASGNESSHYKQSQLSKTKITPWVIFEVIKKMNKRVLLVIDEFDSLTSFDTGFHTSIAYLMKHLSDNSNQCDSRLLVVGVSQSAESLLGRHESIERNAHEVYLNPLRRQDIYNFLTEAEKHLNFRYDTSVKKSLIEDSFGFPFFVHLVGLNCIYSMLHRDKDASVVTNQDYQHAIVRSVDHVFRSQLRKYKEAVFGLESNEMRLIRELIMIEETNPKRASVRERLVKRRHMTEKDFDHTWVRLQQEKKIIYVSRNSDIIRFADPLMKPFLRLKLCKQEIAQQPDHGQSDMFDML